MDIKNNIKPAVISDFLTQITSNKFFWIVSFSLLTAVAAQIAVPVKPVPFTLQTMIVLLSGAFLGAKNGAYSQLLYLTLGSLGLPVFAQVPDGAIGIARLFGPTGGYLLAFPAAAFITGYLIEKNKKYLSVILSMFLANIVILISGIFYLNIFFIHDLTESVKTGGAVFTVWMVIKVFAAASIYTGISKKYSKLSN